MVKRLLQALALLLAVSVCALAQESKKDVPQSAPPAAAAPHGTPLGYFVFVDGGFHHIDAGCCFR